jgi:hypothetical protein
MQNKVRMPATEERAASERVVIEAHASEGTPVLRVIDPSSYIARSVGIMGLIGVALIHLVDSGSKLGETPYLFWMYLGLMVASIAVASFLLHTESVRAWGAAGGLAALTMAGYILSRTTGLPGSSGDIGNWGEPLGTI